eukprot:TRINITY_DN4227_c0_g1_i1.p1 TRINITY_DN4227_c0_g1~~TRINITY_DN4227_c0_g1_i1.p1  ORF type:complete len:508 (+),score=87.38 TRINITY_DN4227_c0_g1_i1:30-1553(+)
MTDNTHQPTHTPTSKELEVFNQNPKGPQDESIVMIQDTSTPEDLKSQLLEMFHLAAPAVLINLLFMLLPIVDQIMVGHLGRVQLSTVGLSNALFSASFYFLIGVSSTFETFGSQALGAGDQPAVRRWFLRSVFVISLAAFPIAIILFFSEFLFKNVFFQEEEIAKASGGFNRIILIGVWFQSWWYLLTKYLQVQSIMKPSIYIGVVSNLFNLFGNYLLIYVIHLDIIGAALATTFSRIFSVILLLVYIVKFLPNQQLRLEFSLTAFKDAIKWAPIKEFLKLGIPGGFTLSIEAWVFEAMTIIAGSISSLYISVLSVLLSCAAFTFVTMALGLAVGASIMVGKYVGDGNARMAKKSAAIGLSLGTVGMFFAGSLLFFLRRQIARLFVTDEEVVGMVASGLKVVAVTQVFDGFQGIAGGIARGVGLQRWIVWFNFIGLVVVALPISCALAFGTNVGVNSFWWGLFAGLLVLCVMFAVLFLRLDWDKQIEISKERMKSDKEGLKVFVELP